MRAQRLWVVSVRTVLATLVLSCGGTDDADSGGDQAGAPAASCEPSPERCDGLGDERPGRLSEHTAVYDPERLEMIVFGGTDTIPMACSFGGPVRFTGETWIYDDVCDAWTHVDQEVPPSGRHMAALGDGNMWVFGGRYRSEDAASGPYEIYDDLFRFDVAARRWHEVEVSSERPPARVNGALVWDDARDRLWLAGGNTSGDGAVYEPRADLWSFEPEAGRWERHQPGGTLPPARLFHAGLYDAKRDALVIYGGADGSAFANTASYFGDLWSLDLATLRWTELHDGSGPAPDGRFWAGLVHDTETDTYLLFGGHDDQELGNRNDTWRYDPSEERWEQFDAGDRYRKPARDFCDFPPDFADIDDAMPERRNAHSLVWSPCGHALTFGGKTDCGSTDDVWRFDGDGWIQRLQATEGEVCLRWRDDPDRCGDLCF
ncbi:MAG: kelch repeat-containing protein [Myxococcales bacterium]|jgi:hypothetical protein